MVDTNGRADNIWIDMSQLYRTEGWCILIENSHEYTILKIIKLHFCQQDFLFVCSKDLQLARPINVTVPRLSTDG